jgi:SAM-dependent methyltransferase
MLKDETLVQTAKKVLTTVGYDYGHWTRTVMYKECFRLVNTLNLSQMDALEISAGDKWQKLGFRTFTEANFPQFDICVHKLDRTFDMIIADQVFEHLLWPYRAAKNVYDMLRPGGYFLVTTPFLIRQHAIPIDCSRWTETGMKYFLAECGFPLERTVTGSWGNRACVKANFTRWARRGWFGSLRNEPDFPVAVWALAQK